MRLHEALRQGFGVVNKHWQLVGTQLAAATVNVCAFFLIVALPVAVGVVALGGEIAAVKGLPDIPQVFGRFVSKSVTLLGVVAALVLLFSIFFTVVTVFTFSASSGVIARGVSDSREKFALGRFFSEGKRLFSRMLRFACAAGMVFLPLLILIILIAFLLYVLAARIRLLDTTAGLFAGVFSLLLLLSLLLFLVTFSIALFFYGTAAAVFTGSKGLASLREGVRFLLTDPKAYWLYCILFCGSVLLSLLLAIPGVLLRLLQSSGLSFSVLYQFITLVIQTYFGFYVSSVLFTYYYHVRVFGGTHPVRSPDNEQPAPPLQRTPLPQ